MPDDASLERPSVSSSKDTNGQTSGVSGRDGHRGATDEQLGRMLLVCLSYRIRKAREARTARSLSSSSEMMVRYNWMLNGLLQSGEIAADTSFSELLRIQARSPTMARMLRFGFEQARNAFEEFLYSQCRGGAKRARHEERDCLDTTYAEGTAEEGMDDEKEEGEI